MKTKKVKELIKILEELNPELDIYISSDSEGNGFGSVGYFEGMENGKVLLIFPETDHIAIEDLEKYYE